MSGRNRHPSAFNCFAKFRCGFVIEARSFHFLVADCRNFLQRSIKILGEFVFDSVELYPDRLAEGTRRKQRRRKGRGCSNRHSTLEKVTSAEIAHASPRLYCESYSKWKTLYTCW